MNLRTGLVAVEIEPGDYVIVEAVTHLAELDSGDVVSGDLAQHGPATLRDVTRGFDFPARIQAIGITTAERDALLRD